MKFYLREDGKSFVVVDLETKKYSTRSSYKKTFFDSMEKGYYSMFDFSLNIVKADDKEIIFKETLGCSDNPFLNEINQKEEKYKYIGVAKNTEELMELLKDANLNYHL